MKRLRRLSEQATRSYREARGFNRFGLPMTTWIFPLARKSAFHLPGPLAKPTCQARWVCPRERPHLPNVLAATPSGKWDFRQQRFKHHEANTRRQAPRATSYPSDRHEHNCVARLRVFKLDIFTPGPVLKKWFFLCYQARRWRSP